jgi:hypothetical protein
MIWRFTILDRNNFPTVIEEPVGWDANVAEIARDPDWHGIFFNSQGDEFEFHGVAMKLLKAEKEQYGSQGKMTLIMEEDCGNGFEEFSRARFNFLKYKFYCGDSCYVKIPVENVSEVIDLRSLINQKVNLESLKAFDETTDLTPYAKLPFSLDLPSKGIFVANKAEWTEEDTTDVALGGVPDIAYGSPDPSQDNFAWFQIIPQFDKIDLSEFGVFATAPAPEHEFIKSGFYPPIGYVDPVLEEVQNDTGPSPGDNNFVFFDWAPASPLLVNDKNGNGFDNIDSFSLQISYSFDLTTKDHGIILALYHILCIRHADGKFTYLNKQKIISADPGGDFHGYDSATYWDINTTHNVSYSGVFNNLSLKDGEYLFVAVVGMNGYLNLNARDNLDAYSIISKGGSVEMKTLSYSKPETSKVFMINEAISRIAESITNDRVRAYSEYFGRTDSEPYSVVEDGCGSLEVITDGIRIRRQENKVPGQTSVFAQSLEDIFNGLNPIHNIGIGIEPDANREGYNRLRVEPWRFFYNNTVVLSCTGIGQITRETYEKEIFSTFKFGYNKWEAEEYNGLDEFLTKRGYRTTLERVKNDLVLLSTLIASGYAIEITKRKGNTDSKDWRYDKETFIICVKRNEDAIEVELGNVQAPINIIDPDTLYNYRISPVRNAMRWMDKVLASYEQFDSGAKIIFTDGDGNYFASGEMEDGTCKPENTPLAENVTIDSSLFADVNQAKPFLKAERVIFDYPMSSREYKLIEANPYGLIYFENDCEESLGWIDKISYKPEEGTATFSLIPAIDINPTGCVPVAIRGDGTLPDGVTGIPYTAIINLYGTAPFDISNIVKPGWMIISISGTTIYLNGTPTEVAPSTVSFDLSNCDGEDVASYSNSVDVGIATCEGVAITGTPELPDGYVNTAYNKSFAITGDAPFALSNIVKPSWMNIAIVGSNVVFSGTPPAKDTDVMVSFDITNCSGTNSISFTDTVDIITLCTDVTIPGSPDLPPATVGTPYTYSIPLGGTAPFELANVVKPNWMEIEISGSSIAFSGTPDDAGTDITVSFDVTNCAEGTASFEDTIDVTTGDCCDNSIVVEFIDETTFSHTHNFGRVVDVSIFDTDGELIIADVEDSIDHNSITITFTSSTSGTLLIK